MPVKMNLSRKSFYILSPVLQVYYRQDDSLEVRTARHIEKYIE